MLQAQAKIKSDIIDIQWKQTCDKSATSKMQIQNENPMTTDNPLTT